MTKRKTFTLTLDHYEVEAIKSALLTEAQRAFDVPTNEYARKHGEVILALRTKVRDQQKEQQS